MQCLETKQETESHIVCMNNQLVLIFTFLKENK